MNQKLSKINCQNQTALVVVDYQNDFCDPKGSLYIPEGEKIKDKIITKIKKFKKQQKLITASKDWHPKNHSSFKLWPVHGVRNTWGARMPFSERWFDFIVYKGQDPDIDSYSAFIDHANQSNGLHEWLQKHNVKTVVIIGLATDVCVNATIQHALELGYQTIIDLDCCRGTKNEIILNPIKLRS